MKLKVRLKSYLTYPHMFLPKNGYHSQLHMGLTFNASFNSCIFGWKLWAYYLLMYKIEAKKLRLTINLLFVRQQYNNIYEFMMVEVKCVFGLWNTFYILFIMKNIWKILYLFFFNRAALAKMRMEQEESERLRKELEEKVKIMEEEQKQRMKGIENVNFRLYPVLYLIYCYKAVFCKLWNIKLRWGSEFWFIYFSVLLNIYIPIALSPLPISVISHSGYCFN